jgi:hypothetical protein
MGLGARAEAADYLDTAAEVEPPGPARDALLERSAEIRAAGGTVPTLAPTRIAAIRS